jgi:hypothetical protein
MNEERKDDNPACCCWSAGGTCTTIQSLTAQLGEAWEALERIQKEGREFYYNVGSSFGDLAANMAKQALSRSPSSALARYRAMEEVAKAAKGLFAGLDWSWETRVTWDRLGPLHEALHALREVPHDTTD